MFRKSFISFLFLTAVVALGTINLFAQDPVRGIVELQKADGSLERVADAVVEVFRIDIKTGARSAKTNKKGEFVFVGLMFGGSYALSASAPNCAPSIVTDIKPGQENVKITLSPGDGRKWTEAEVRKAAADDGKAGGGTSEPTAAEKKAQEDQAKANSENDAARKNAEDTNKNINTLLKDGIAALDAKNYDVAIAKFDEGYRADPDFEGSAPVLLTNKGEALKQRGTIAFNSRNTGTDVEKAAAMQKARDDFKQAAAAFEKAIEILEKAPAAADPAAQKRLTTSKVRALERYVVLHGPMAMAAADPAKTREAMVLFDKYRVAETDDALETPVIVAWAKAMGLAGESKNAIHAYRLLLEKKPDDLDAMYGLGSALWVNGVGVDPANEAEVQEGVNLLQKFVDAAPDTHPGKANAKENIEYLKESTKVVPKKTAPAKRRN